MACTCGLRLLQPGDAQANTPSDAVKRLSAREIEVLTVAARGLTNQEVGVALGISLHTIKNHLWKVRRKLGVDSTIEAILLMRGVKP